MWLNLSTLEALIQDKLGGSRDRWECGMRLRGNICILIYYTINVVQKMQKISYILHLYHIS